MDLTSSYLLIPVQITWTHYVHIYQVQENWLGLGRCIKDSLGSGTWFIRPMSKRRTCSGPSHYDSVVAVCLCHSVQYNQYLPVTQRGSTRISIRCRCLCSDTATKWPSPGCADKILGVTSVIFCKFTLSPLQAQNLGLQALI